MRWIRRGIESGGESVLLDVVEGGRFLEGMPETAEVFDMAAVAADPRVKDIVQGVLSEE